MKMMDNLYPVFLESFVLSSILSKYVTMGFQAQNSKRMTKIKSGMNYKYIYCQHRFRDQSDSSDVNKKHSHYRGGKHVPC